MFRTNNNKDDENKDDENREQQVTRENERDTRTERRKGPLFPFSPSLSLSQLKEGEKEKRVVFNFNSIYFDSKERKLKSPKSEVFGKKKKKKKKTPKDLNNFFLLMFIFIVEYSITKKNFLEEERSVMAGGRSAVRAWFTQRICSYK